MQYYELDYVLKCCLYKLLITGGLVSHFRHKKTEELGCSNSHGV